jgi:hypothetical protein
LVKIYTVAHMGADNGPAVRTNAREGTRAIIEALQDAIPRSLAEVGRQECCGRGVQTYGPPECCGIPDLFVTTDQVHDAFSKILDSDVEDGAVSDPTQVGHEAHKGVADAQPAPSHSPAADVCEWTTESIDAMGYGWMTSECGFKSHERDLMKQVVQPFICPSCGKPITFKETP